MIAYNGTGNSDGHWSNTHKWNVLSGASTVIIDIHLTDPFGCLFTIEIFYDVLKHAPIHFRVAFVVKMANFLIINIVVVVIKKKM